MKCVFCFYQCQNIHIVEPKYTFCINLYSLPHKSGMAASEAMPGQIIYC